MSADRPDRDGTRRPVTTVTDGVDSCPFDCARETQKMVMVVLWSGVKVSADRSDRDGSRRPVTTVTDGVNSCPFDCRKRDLKNGHSGVMEWGGNVGGSSRSGRIETTRHNRDGWCQFVSV